MNDIDFLPSDYVCVKTKRNKSNWLRCLFAVVLVLIGVGWAAQRQSMSELMARRNRMQEQSMVLLSRDWIPRTSIESGIEPPGKRRTVDRRPAIKGPAVAAGWQAIVGALPSQTVITDIRSEIDEGQTGHDESQNRADCGQTK